MHSISILHIFSSVVLHRCWDEVRWHCSNHKLINAKAKKIRYCSKRIQSSESRNTFFYIRANDAATADTIRCTARCEVFQALKPAHSYSGRGDHMYNTRITLSFEDSTLHFVTFSTHDEL